METATPESQQLNAVARQLAPCLGQAGFIWREDAKGSSSGGPFATGYFEHDVMRIGLLWRRGSGLGAINHITHTPSGKEVPANHDGLMEALGFDGKYQFCFDDDLTVWKPFARHGGDLIDALLFDFQQLLLPALEADPNRIKTAICQAYEEYYSRRGWPVPK